MVLEFDMMATEAAGETCLIQVDDVEVGKSASGVLQRAPSTWTG